MIPFVRMFEYGNSSVTPYIKDISFGLSSSILYMVLLSNGDMYVGGNNDSGQLGMGDKNSRFRQMFFSRSDVRLIGCSPNTSMYITNDNRIFFAGDQSIRNNSGTIAGRTTFEDITDTLFSTIDVSQIKKISVEQSIAVLMNNGDVYGIGLNRFGALGVGHDNYLPLTKIATDVKDVQSTAQTVVYIKNDGTVWGAGRNRYYCLKSSTDGGILDENIMSFYRMFSTVQDDILNIRISIGSVSVYTSTAMYSTGDNNYGVFGDGNTGGTTNTTGLMITTPLTVPVLVDNPHQNIVYTANNVSSYIGIDNKIYSTGYNSNGSLGLGVSPNHVGKFTEVPGVIIGENDLIRFGQYNSYIGRNYNAIWGCGNQSNGTCMTTDVFTNSFKNLLLLPWLN